MKSIKNLYILVGPPGSGKGSLSALCSKRLGWAHLSTGSLCRSHIERKTDIGRAITQVISEGKLIDDTVITAMVIQWIGDVSQHTSDIVLDGFPRTVAQAEALDAFVENHPLYAFSIHVVTMELADTIVVERIKGRIICENVRCQAIYSRSMFSDGVGAPTLLCNECQAPLKQRVDDKHELIYDRLATYHKHARDIVLYYEKAGARLFVLNTESSLDQVFQLFMNLLSHTVAPA